MVKPLPGGCNKDTQLCGGKLKEKPFDFGTAKVILKDNSGALNVALSELRKLGWLDIRLQTSEEAIKEIAKGG